MPGPRAAITVYVARRERAVSDGEVGNEVDAPDAVYAYLTEDQTWVRAVPAASRRNAASVGEPGSAT